MINRKASLSKDGMLAFAAVLFIMALIQRAYSEPHNFTKANPAVGQLLTPKLSPLKPNFKYVPVYTANTTANKKPKKSQEAAKTIQSTPKTVDKPVQKPVPNPSQPPQHINSPEKPLFAASNPNNAYAYFKHKKEIPQKEAPKKPSPPSVTWKSAFGLIIRLAIVAALAYGCLLGLKWILTKQKICSVAENRNLAVSGTISLGANKSIHVVRAGNKEFLIGTAGDNINLLADLGDAKEELEQPEQESFNSILASFSADGGAGIVSAVAGRINDAASILRQKADRLYKANISGRSQ